tara:strand:- start:11369 stop:12628 length:1260 start_codon:yes stop_codon:yes gene_type:complete
VLNSFIKAGFTYAFSDLLRKIAPFLLLPLYVSQLSIEQFGKLEYLTILTTFFSLLISWGSIQGLLRLYPDYGKVAVFQSIILSFTIFISLIFLVSILYIVFDLHILLAIETKNILFLCLLFGLIYSINNIAFTILRSEERLLEFTIFNLASVILQIISIAYFIFNTDIGYLSKFYGIICSNLVLLIFLSFFVFNGKIELSPAKDIRFEVLKFYSPIAGGNLIGWISGSIDKIIVKIILGDSALGIYAFACQIAQIFKLSIESFLKAFNVLVYKNVSLRDSLFEKRHFLIIIFQILALVYLYMITWATNLPIMQEYKIELHVLALILLSRVFLLMNFVETIFYYSKLNSTIVAKAALISLIIISISIFPLVKNYGLFGAASSLVIFSLSSYAYLNFKHENSFTKLVKNILFIATPWLLMM